MLHYTVKAAPTPLLSITVLRTDSESKPRCPEQPEAYNFTNLQHDDRRKKMTPNEVQAKCPQSIMRSRDRNVEPKYMDAPGIRKEGLDNEQTKTTRESSRNPTPITAPPIEGPRSAAAYERNDELN